MILVFGSRARHSFSRPPPIHFARKWAIWTCGFLCLPSEVRPTPGSVQLWTPRPCKPRVSVTQKLSGFGYPAGPRMIGGNLARKVIAGGRGNFSQAGRVIFRVER